MAGNNIVLRAATAKDLRALHALDQVCYPPGIAYSIREVGYFLRRPGAVSVVAENQAGRLAGFAIAEPARAGKIKAGHVTTVDVAPEARRTGVGTALMDALESQLAGRGFKLVTLEVAIDNTGAQCFYVGRGYDQRAIIHGYYMGTIDALVMDKILGFK